MGAAIVMPLSLTLLTSAFPPRKRGAVVGIWGGVAGLAVAAGPLIGGGLTEGPGWHWIFWVNVPIGALATLFSRLRLKESRGPADRLDLPGLVLVTAGALGLVWGLTRGPQAGWGSGEVVATITSGIILLVAFIAWELRAATPMLPMGLFRSPAFAAGNATAFLMVASLFAAAFFVSQYFQFVLRYSPLNTGIRLLPWTAAPMVVAPLAGMVSDRIGRRPVIVVGLAMQAIGLGWVAMIAATGLNYSALVFPLIVAGVGVSMALPTVPTAILSAVSPQHMGKASGTNSMLQRFGSVFGIAVGSAIFAANGHLGSAAAFTAGFRPSLTLIAGFSLLGAIAALAITGRRLPAVAGLATRPAPIPEVAAG